MTDAYTIKPLEWRNEAGLLTECVFGWMAVRSHGKNCVKRHWLHCFHDDDGLVIEECESYEDGKAKAEAFYLSRLMPALQPAVIRPDEEQR
jgi:hypothetical protein